MTRTLLFLGGGGAGVCYSFQKGECDRGSNCRFSHEGGGGGGGGYRGGGGRGGDRGGDRGGMFLLICDYIPTHCLIKISYG